LKIEQETTMKPRIYVDFNTMNMVPGDRVYVGRKGDERDNQDLLESLPLGSRVTLYDEEFEVEAVLDLVKFRDDQVVWVGEPDWSTRRNTPAS
jgi:hypothetical protein